MWLAGSSRNAGLSTFVNATVERSPWARSGWKGDAQDYLYTSAAERLLLSPLLSRFSRLLMASGVSQLVAQTHVPVVSGLRRSIIMRSYPPRFLLTPRPWEE